MLKIYSEPESVSDGLDEILVRAEEAKEVPPEPEGGIPRQWLPGLIRWPVRVFLLPVILIDLAAQRVELIYLIAPAVMPRVSVL